MISLGRVLGTQSFLATSQGYGQLLVWLQDHGDLVRVGIEGTGSYGMGLTRYLTSQKVEVIEVNRPNRQTRRRYGKTDVTDAEGAAVSALNGQADSVPKSSDGPIEAIRALQITRRSAIKARTQAINQIKDLIITAPSVLADQLKPLNTYRRIEKCARFKQCEPTDPTKTTKYCLRELARRYQNLTEEVTQLDKHIERLCQQANPELLKTKGIGPETAATLMIAAGDNPQRMKNEASFAALCGVSPIQASTGKTVRHRLNRNGNRQANNALWTIAMVRLSCDNKTQQYVKRRQAEGKTKPEAIRCLKRYIARETYKHLTHQKTLDNP